MYMQVTVGYNHLMMYIMCFTMCYLQFKQWVWSCYATKMLHLNIQQRLNPTYLEIMKLKQKVLVSALHPITTSVETTT